MPIGARPAILTGARRDGPSGPPRRAGAGTGAPAAGLDGGASGADARAVPRRPLPLILRDRDGRDVIVPATLAGSAAVAALVPVGPGRAAELARAASRGGGLWVVRGDRWAAVVPAREYLDGRWDHLGDREAVRLFDGDRPRAQVLDGLEPVELIVPVAGWDSGRALYFHRDSPLFATVPVLRKRDHRVTVVRGLLSDEDRRLMGRRMVEGQTCGVLSNELGGACVVPDGEVASDVRAVHGERIRFIVDGMRDLAAAAGVIDDWAGRFDAAAAAGWVLQRPIDNAFLYAANRRRLRTLLPLPPAGALVPVGVAGPGSAPAAGAVPAGELEQVAPLAAAAAASGADGGPHGGSGDRPGDGPGPALALADELVDRVVAELLGSPPDPPGRAEGPSRARGLPVLRRDVFRRPRGRLLRPDTGGGPVEAVVRIVGAEVTLVQGRLPDDTAARITEALEDDASLAGEWALCRGAFGHVLAEMGSPLRAVESMSSSASYAHLLDGSASLDEAARRLRRVAAQLARLADEGWTLSQPVAGFWFRLRSPALRRAGA